MSDTLEKKYPTGNSAEPLSLPGQGDEVVSLNPTRRRLIEECTSISMADIRIIYKRIDLLRLADAYKPVAFRLGRQRFSLHLISESIPRPRYMHQTGDETIRIWLTCPNCFRRVQKVYTFRIDLGSPILADPKCSRCHGLVYLSKNSSGNRWWKNFAMPLKRLLRRRQRLLLRHSPRSMAQLEKVEQFIWMLRERAAVRRRAYQGIAPNARRKRLYRDLTLIQ
jgi:hypothetical protein